MERLLVVKAEVRECDAEVMLNGIPLARLSAARPSTIVPVHEYTLAGPNRLQITVWPLPAVPPKEPPARLSLVSSGRISARVGLLLPRVGAAVEEASVRNLAQLEWAPPEGEGYEAPHLLSNDATLSVNFPRWRWLDAPPTEPTADLTARVLAYVQGLARDLADGQPEHYISAARLRIEELSLAYQRRPEDEAARLHRHLLALHEAQRLTWRPLEAANFHLRPLAGGRLLECLDATGEAALRTEPDELGRDFALPLRVSVVDGKVYILR
jgi:hypothetical protein